MSIDFDELRRRADEMVDDLRRRGVVPGVEIGESAPTFRLPDATGAEVDLGDRLADGPVVLVFYRGSWCPYCNVHLQAFQAGLSAIGDRGASLVAVSPQAPDDSLEFSERLDLGFDVLSDLDQSVIEQWRLRFELPEAFHDVYRAMNMDLELHNADGTWFLPVPATFVIDTTGIVRARHVDPNYRERMPLDDVLAALDRLER